MALPRVLPDAEPLPPCDGGSTTATLVGSPPPERHVCPAIQPTARAVGPPVRRPLRGALDRKRAAPASRLPLRREQPCPREAMRRSFRLAVEQRRYEQVVTAARSAAATASAGPHAASGDISPPRPFSCR